ncbi:hypothetical protein V8C44DRAFT_370788 [Trichoderma aethiopicum]
MDCDEKLSPTHASSTDGFSALRPLTHSESKECLAELPATPERLAEKRLKEERKYFFTAVLALEHAITGREIDVGDFWSAYGEFAGRISHSHVGNLLHVVVEMLKLRPHLLERAKRVIIEKIVKGFPEVLIGQNVDGYNPVHLAIRDGSYKLFWLIDSICYTKIESEQCSCSGIKRYFDEALAQTCSVANRTALHTYFGTITSWDFRTVYILVEDATDEQLAAQDADGNTPMHYAASFRNCTSYGLKIVKMLLDRDDNIIKEGDGSGQTSFLEIRNDNGYSVYQSLVESTDDERHRHRVVTQDGNPLQATAFQEMSLLLKMHYMRTRGHREATSFLYGKNVDDIEISFHYDNMPININWQDFIDRFGQDSTSGIKLDSVLQSVILPRIEITQHGEDVGNSSCRDDMTCIFRWLHAKGVRHVISLSVDDSGLPLNNVDTHDAIQKCLSHFSVESLDWQEEDMDLEVIYNATLQWRETNPYASQPPLRELWLRWSGKSPILHSWSRKEGLPKFGGLERVFLFKPERHGTSDEEIIEQAIAQFRAELAKNSSKIEVIVKESVTKPAIRRHPRVAPPRGKSGFPPNCGSELREHLESASCFSNWLEREWTLLREESASTAKKDVVVAVIGDGVDIMDEALHNQCLMGKSFDYRESKHGQIREVFVPPFVSGSDGTAMANLILHVCPMAKIYPIRLPKGGYSLDANSLAKAIEAALARKVTIISLPRVTMHTWDEDGPGKERLIRALERVQQQNVLMLCSSAMADVFYAYPKGILFIDDRCEFSDKRLQDSGKYFIFPGLDSPLAAARFSMPEERFVNGFTKRFSDFDCDSSNSVSTALATGLAAVIIYLVKLGIMSNNFCPLEEGMMVNFGFAEDAAETITRTDVMARVFRGLCPDADSPDLGEVWHSLIDKMSQLDTGIVRSRRGRLLAIAYMALLNCR